MSNIREVFLSLNDVEDMIQNLECKYDMTSADFLTGDEEAMKAVSEDDSFHWEALIDHRLALRSESRKVHMGYLTRLVHKPQQEIECGREVNEMRLVA